ncbi:hypothetical protein OE88DRAFT_1733416 [Heliocybe sulcata]|uniref:Uncharacterized protein n=1 Tax=Heliocybe sulcata TaxID=5364 RepID=A0A5C3NIS6_9AGAM|nr:hypothetical protein OE88DRAFT_1733416 [Heliocybe sulcata]
MFNNVEPAGDISPFWVAVILSGAQGMITDPDVVEALEPELAPTLCPWLLLRRGDVIRDACYPAVQLGIHYLENDFADALSALCDEQFHECLRRQLICKALLGHPDPWETAEFKAFKEGFDIQLRSSNNGPITVVKALLEKIKPLEVCAFVATLYDLELKDVEDVLHVLLWDVDELDQSAESLLFHKVFRARFTQFLGRAGIPTVEAALRGGLAPMQEVAHGLIQLSVNGANPTNVGKEIVFRTCF